MDGVSLALNWYLSTNMNLMLDWAYDNRYNLPSATPSTFRHELSGPHERLRRQVAIPILATGPKSLKFLQETIAMRTYLFGLIGVALLCGGPLLGQAPDGRACSPATCGAATCGAATCGETGCNACGNCCPHCGCRLVPVCHVYCAPKTVVEHQYTCLCEEVCIPGCSCCWLQAVRQLRRFRLGPVTPATTVARRAAAGKCIVRQVPRLVIHPVPKEVPVRKCTVEWVCPNCGGCGQCGATAARFVPTKIQIVSDFLQVRTPRPCLSPFRGGAGRSNTPAAF